MSGHSRQLLPITVSLVIALFFYVARSAAQTAYNAILTTPDTSHFPHITAYLDVHDPTGGFVHGLRPQDVSMQENGVSVPVSALEEQRPGVQFVIAITPGEALSIRDGMGNSRYDYLLQGMLAGSWVNQPPGEDDFSLITMGGPQLIHTSNPLSLQSSLQAYKPDNKAIPSLEVLASALLVAADPTNRTGMERAILFITPPQPTDVSLGLQSIISSAQQQNIRVFVWLLAAPEVFDLPEIDPLRNLADQTRGAFFAFSRAETVPDLETMLEPLRHIYQLGYDSHISAAGIQQVEAQVTINSELITTPVQSFELNLLPPVPAFLNPPVEITRDYAVQSTPASTDGFGELRPLEEMLKIQVAFPDGHDRSVALTRLYVDDNVAAENTSPPFDQLVWDLRPYTQDGTHLLRVEVIDNLGLVGSSGAASIKIVAPTTTQDVMATVARKSPLVIGVTVIVSASILVLVLIVGGRIRPKPHPGQVTPLPGSTDKTRPSSYRERMRQRNDPVTQPVRISPQSPVKANATLKHWWERLPWLKPKEVPVPAMAYLIPLVGSDDPTLPAPLQIREEDVTLGTDSHQANLLVADPSVELLHAWIHHEDNTFRISDAGSVAGTWVNYERVSPQGTPLEHMDIIHLGRLGFRFKLSEPGPLQKIAVTPLEPKR